MHVLCVCIAPPSPALNGSPPPADVAVLATTVEDARTDSRSESRTDSRNESRNDSRDDSRPASEQPAKQTDAPTPPAKREDKQLTAPVTNNNVEKEVGDKKVEELYDIPVGEYAALVLLAAPVGTDWHKIEQYFWN